MTCTRVKERAAAVVAAAQACDERTGRYRYTGRICTGDNIFHMHIDGKIGLLEERNYAQKHASRLLFSIVTDTLGPGGEEAAAIDGRKYGTTVSSGPTRCNSLRVSVHCQHRSTGCG